MWISLFTVVLVIALGLGWGALALESYDEENRRGRKAVRGLRSMRNA